MYIDFIKIEKIYLHEKTEKQRLEKLKAKVTREKTQRNPIIVTEYNQGYLVLDGAHRYTTLKEIGCQYAMCQVVEENDYSIKMWKHQITYDDFLKINPKLDDCSFINAKSIECFFKDECLKINISNYECDNLVLYKYKELVSKINRCNSFKRILNISGNNLNDEVLIVYPSLTIDIIKNIVSKGETIPAGISRVDLKCGRVLSVNIPLEILNNPKRHLSVSKNINTNLRKYEDTVYMYEGDMIYE
ncbi:ParB N-terminal domain-containing protein [Staphylococcus epidermidis]|uniref:ParB N-terminal domain-containing protein n=1 Tax=Staphylococcus epidermidis TaxID=1282 RepID=UPI00241F7C17|nr:ParB N-terminal domain-containing protein [Staphylococcus epidermidis]